ncbi:hypothetical protein EVAR_97366_1 [Eumeta japonica]|uniref:Uncharacterized protein n=1 Tax=Eumeta variegata TaxID=151549 RepID=A0A4C1YYZ8_EUMVA|nr:hypothetical protein EVAR_97366_1 [Eumeta japonica]
MKVLRRNARGGPDVREGRAPAARAWAVTAPVLFITGYTIDVSFSPQTISYNFAYLYTPAEVVYYLIAFYEVKIGCGTRGRSRRTSARRRTRQALVGKRSVQKQKSLSKLNRFANGINGL